MKAVTVPPRPDRPIPEGTPRCQTCGSTNLERITGGKKVGKAALIGVFAIGTMGKTYKCRSCGVLF